ncbi:hypothetical protein [Trichococcus ilyis]|jgi:hypothetical protein|uniref:Uncharacterized protein n=1 Tax=Trichococcus ilyis TaxID=640938 RepID=A0A143Z602_9LACT|nr:hypothetical protein [Trichococcus ilyis]CZR08353.1 Hypothetical protein TR210_2566 [Trichococcus ilyis]SEJ76316.1 hypothetical protein SAMN05216375_12535 [Trichococcus ilyis]
MKAKLRIFLTLMRGIFSDVAIQGVESAQKSKKFRQKYASCCLS